MKCLLLVLLAALVPAIARAQGAVQEIRPNDVANILDYGADPTGTSDSIAAINTALGTGRNVRIPRGTYIITAGWIDMKVAGQRLFCEDSATITVVQRQRPICAKSSHDNSPCSKRSGGIWL